jgi:hypothetical protein
MCSSELLHGYTNCDSQVMKGLADFSSSHDT